MKRMIAFLIGLAVAAAVTGQETPQPVAAPQKDSALVKAAKSNGGPKRKSTRKVITNNDVKKSKGKLVELPKKPTQAATTPSAAKGPLATQDDQLRAENAASQKVAIAQTKVSELEKELSRLEQAYYEAADPNYRDTTIQTRFNQTKRQLDDARKSLADARDAEAKSKQ